MARRKNLGSKRNDITDADREVIVKAYGEFTNTTYESDGKACESKIFNNIIECDTFSSVYAGSGVVSAGNLLIEDSEISSNIIRYLNTSNTVPVTIYGAVYATKDTITFDNSKIYNRLGS